MALKKSQMTKHGIVADYWRIGILNNHPRSNSVQVVLDCYVSKELRQADCYAVDYRELSLDRSTIGDGSLTEVYNAIKQLAEWEDAENI